MTKTTKQELLVKDEAILIAEIILAKSHLTTLEQDLKEVRSALKRHKAKPAPILVEQE